MRWSSPRTRRTARRISAGKGPDPFPGRTHRRTRRGVRLDSGGSIGYRAGFVAVLAGARHRLPMFVARCDHEVLFVLNSTNSIQIGSPIQLGNDHISRRSGTFA